MTAMREILSRSDAPEAPLQGQEFYESRLSEEPNELGTRYCVLQIRAAWIERNHDVNWDSEEVDYFWALDEAKERYAERRAALGLQAFIHSDMDW
jgi:hypothetical protein